MQGCTLSLAEAGPDRVSGEEEGEPRGVLSLFTALDQTSNSLHFLKTRLSKQRGKGVVATEASSVLSSVCLCQVNNIFYNYINVERQSRGKEGSGGEDGVWRRERRPAGAPGGGSGCHSARGGPLFRLDFLAGCCGASSHVLHGGPHHAPGAALPPPDARFRVRVRTPVTSGFRLRSEPIGGVMNPPTLLTSNRMQAGITSRVSSRRGITST